MSSAVASKICKPSSPSMATSVKPHGFADSRTAASGASNCRWLDPKGRRVERASSVTSIRPGLHTT